MIPKETIEEVKKRLIKTYNPLEIYLFGSYARETPNEESDLDLLIIVETSDEKLHQRSLKGYDALYGLRVPNDIIVYTKTEFEQRAIDQMTLAHKIKMTGKKIYAKA